MADEAEVVDGFIVVLTEDFRAANLADQEHGARVRILGWGHTRSEALRDVDASVDNPIPDETLRLEVIEATGELITAWEDSSSETIALYCRLGRARLARGAK